MTPGERMVYAAVYAAELVRLRAQTRAWDRSDLADATEAADLAGCAVEDLREVCKHDDFGADARDVIGFECGDYRQGDRLHHRDSRQRGTVVWGATGPDNDNTIMVLLDEDSDEPGTVWWRDSEIATHYRADGTWVR